MSLSEKSNRTFSESLPTGSEYDVGYKKPPKETQFKSGQSGNPKGRPKGSTSTAALLKKALAMPVTHMVNGNLKKTSRDAAIYVNLTAKAVKGDIKAVKLVSDLKDRFGLDHVEPPLHNILVTFVKPPVYPPDE